MNYELTPAYDHADDIRELFFEYFEMIQAGDDNFTRYLQMQNSKEELEHLDYKYGMPRGRIYLLRCNGKAAGCVALRQIDDEKGELKRMYVRPEYRKFGFGELMVKKILADAKEAGYRYLLLDTLPFLQSAIRLYHRCGFYDIPPYNDSPMNDTVYMRFDL